MAAGTEPKLAEEIDGVLPAEGGETTEPNPKDPGPVVPNGGPYQGQSEPVTTK